MEPPVALLWKNSRLSCCCRVSYPLSYSACRPFPWRCCPHWPSEEEGSTQSVTKSASSAPEVQSLSHTRGRRGGHNYFQMFQGILASWNYLQIFMSMGMSLKRVKNYLVIRGFHDSEKVKINWFSWRDKTNLLNQPTKNCVKHIYEIMVGRCETSPRMRWDF